MKQLLTLFFILSTWINIQAQEAIDIGTKIPFTSKILKQDRFLNIYLPPSYNARKKQSYPVFYIIDGDYNFHYLTGLVEQLSNISQRIPEMIVVGIADLGAQQYVEECSPNKKANDFIDFLVNEVQPFINTKYRTSNYNILFGQSRGGLLVTHTLLEKPESYDAFIAVSPAIWWNNFKEVDEIRGFFRKNENLNKHFFLSIGNEKGMGVHHLYDLIDRNIFMQEYKDEVGIGLEIKFNNYPDENHNSVGLISAKDALEWIFELHDISKKRITSMANFGEYETLMHPIVDRLGLGYSISKNQMRLLVNHFATTPSKSQDLESSIAASFPASLETYYQIVGDIYFKKLKDLEQAKTYYNKAIKEEMDHVENYMSLAAVNLALGEQALALELYKKALRMAKKQGARNWYINYIQGNIDALKR